MYLIVIIYIIIWT